MDSLTQLTLGMAVAHSVLRKSKPIHTLTVGAAIGTLPDLDVLISFGDPVSNFVYHRGFSHSLLVLTVLAPLIAWVWHKFLLKSEEEESPSYQRTVVATWLVLISHILIDAFTIYGTRIFWPSSSVPESWSIIFIIDPLYTLPLLAGVILAAKYSRRRWNDIGIALSSAYLLWCGLAKVIVNDTLDRHWKMAGYSYEKSFSTPTPFNTILWRGVAYSKENSVYYETYVSLPALFVDYWKGKNRVKSDIFPIDISIVEQFKGQKDHLEHLEWFADGFLRYRQENGQFIVADIRMGGEPQYVFEFNLGPLNQEGAFTPTRVPFNRDVKILGPIKDRILSH